jgi:cation:H+ antiporter
MSSWLAALLFIASVAVTLGAAGLFADRLDHIGPRLGLPESLTGLLTAFAADAPEISSALIALGQGRKGVSLGVVVGSNVFNLAAMIGASALLAGVVRIGPRALAVEGAVALASALIVVGLLAGMFPTAVALIGFAAVLFPYAGYLARSRAEVSRVLGPRVEHPDEAALWRAATLALLAVALIVVASFGMVGFAVDLARRWDVPASLVGLLVLAVVTSLPNAFTAIRLGLGGRGTALVSETLNSNTINLLGGVILPSLVIGAGSVSGGTGFGLGWLIGMTVLALALLVPRSGMGRLGGGALVLCYLAFIAVQVASR